MGTMHDDVDDWSQGVSSGQYGDRMEIKLELVPIPVSDVDRAKAFYVDKLGFAVDVGAWGE